MAPLDRNNYFKLVALIVDVACQVIWKYISEKIHGPDSFGTFLKKEKHKLVHMFETFECCECSFGKISGQKLISKKQLLILYELNDKNIIRGHKKHIGGKLTQICICKYSARANVDVKVIDITLANYIIQICGKHELGLDNWITKIKDVRNEIFHLSDTQEITDDKFNRKWIQLEGSILGIANLINRAYAVETERKILQTKKVALIPYYMLKYEVLCRDYWRHKCAEFERAQIEEIELKAKTLHTTFPQFYSKSMQEDCQKTMNEIKYLKLIIDKINILIKVFGKGENTNTWKETRLEKEDIPDLQRVHVPAFIQLDLPASWNKSEVFEYLDEMRLNGMADTKIRIIAISPEDMNMYTEIAKTVLKNVDLLQAEISQIMSRIIKDAAIDSKQSADMGVNLTIPDIREKHCQITDENAVDGAYYLSALPDDKTGIVSKCEAPLPFNDDSFQGAISLLCKIRINGNWFRKLLKAKKENLTINDCAIIGESVILLDDYNTRLIIHNKDGSYMRDIKLSSKPWCIAVINHNDIAVSFNQPYIEIININKKKATNRIVTSGEPFGISYQNELLYVVIRLHKIDVIDLTGNIIRSFPCPSSSVWYITTDRERLFLADYSQDTLYCCDLYGSVTWKFTDDKLKYPCGVTADLNGNVYVASNSSDKVVVVSHDGEHNKELLTREDELISPVGICFDKSNNHLLICNTEPEYAFLYDVNH